MLKHSLFLVGLLLASCGSGERERGWSPQYPDESPCSTLVPSSSTQPLSIIYPAALFVEVDADDEQTSFTCDEPPANPTCVGKLDAGCALHHEGSVSEASSFSLVLRAENANVDVYIRDVEWVELDCPPEVLAIESAPSEVARGASERLNFRFAPTTPRRCEGVVSLTSDASNMVDTLNDSPDARVLQVRIVATAE